MSFEFPTVSELKGLAAKLPLFDFTKRFPHHYLITETAGSLLRTPSQLLTTSEAAALRAGTQRGVFGVAPVVKREGANPYTTMITLGRARNSDVPITDISVSKVHAWIRRGEGRDFSSGDFFIADGGSRNGSFANGIAISREPHPLPPGMRLRLGLVELWFVDGERLHAALRYPGSYPSGDLWR